jgi:hypothetical protein
MNTQDVILQVGNRRKVECDDEHKQPIWISRTVDGYWWYFADWPGADQGMNGPFPNFRRAHFDANAYCNEGAP